MGWKYLSIPKLQRQHRWSLEMDMLFHPTLCNRCNYLFILGWMLMYVSKRNPSYWNIFKTINPIQWRHNKRDGVSNHRRLHCLLNCWFRSRSKKTSKLCVTGRCEGNSPVTGALPTQKASNAENVSIWWRHHAGSHRSTETYCIPGGGGLLFIFFPFHYFRRFPTRNHAWNNAFIFARCHRS